MQEKKKMSLTMQIMIAMVAGLVLGIVLNTFFKETVFVQSVLIEGTLGTIGSMFINALKMMVVPLVFISLVTGVTSFGDISSLGRVSLKTVSLYLLTTFLAIGIALSIAIIIDPGANFQLGESLEKIEINEAPSVSQMFINMIPSNPLQAMVEGNMLAIIMFALLFGVAISLAGESGQHVKNFFEDLNNVVMRMVKIVMKLAPIGVFALITKTFAVEGLDMIAPLAGYFLTLAGLLILHGLLVYGALIKFLAKLNPITFFKKMRDVHLFAFSISSSNATIPVNLKNAKERLGIKNSVASFTIPLGATINMDGGAIMQAVATVFIANVYGVDLGLSEYLMIMLMATLVSIGTAGIPGMGLIMLGMVLAQVNVPVEGIALIMGIDRLLDMIRTVVNVTGDAAVTTVVAKSEDAIDLETFNSKET